MNNICKEPLISSEKYDAVLFDLDGVITDTARVHATAWKEMFDAFLKRWSELNGQPFLPFNINTDYKKYVDGKLRYEGVLSFLQSRGINLPFGQPDTEPNMETICGLGNLKNRKVNAIIKTQGVDIYQGGVDLARHIRSLGLKTAVVSASKNCRTILEAAGIAHLFHVRVDGEVAEQLALSGKPAPDTFLEAARQLKVQPSRAVIIEDAIAGVLAGKQGGFALIVGIGRQDDAPPLMANGAHLVVQDPGELISKCKES